jgi:hypothetical protein
MSMPENITISEISIAGFRAFLRPQSFTLRRNDTPLSLAVFAPNAKGKSSLVDAIEFFFSSDGTLARLGVRRSGTQAGRDALGHVEAEEADVTSEVRISFATNSGSIDGVRTVERCEDFPVAAVIVKCVRKLNFLIRGYELRRFVEDQTALDRYQEVSGWFGLTSLTDIERNLRSLRLRLQQDLDTNAQAEKYDRDVRRFTKQSITSWDEGEALVWFNADQLQPLDSTLTVNTLDAQGAIYQLIVERKKQEDKSVGLAALIEVSEKAQAVYRQQPSEDDGFMSETGAIMDLESAIAIAVKATKSEAEERAKSSDAVFKEVCDAASALFDNSFPEIEVCPVCDTPLQDTAKGSREDIALHLKTQIATLERYNRAVKALTAANTSVQRRCGDAITALRSAQAALKAARFVSQAEDVETYVVQLESWELNQPLPDSTSVKSMLIAVTTKVDKERQLIEEQQGDHTYAKCLATLDELIQLKVEADQNENTRMEARALLQSLTELETSVGSRIRTYVQTVIDTLKEKVNELYRAVHPDQTEAPAITLDLSTETRQPQLSLLVDFSPNRKGVAPSGYLSDSQVHTLALSLRLAAIQLFNKRVPLVVLDDVVTSYDADHRRAIASMLAAHFADFQVVLVTHDERFFAYLKEHLPQSSWVFKRIIALDHRFGPRFHDHRVGDALIEGKLSSGQSAANDIRQAEEEWLLDICRGFRVEVEIRDVHRPYNYERSELAIALHKFLKASKISPPRVSGISNPFLISLQTGELENFGSHFSDDPSAWPSPGDEEHRWQEFKYFRGLFVCPRCGAARFKRPKGMDRPVCVKCETTFDFKTT